MGGMDYNSKQKRKSRFLLCPPSMELLSVALVCYRMCYCNSKIVTVLQTSFMAASSEYSGCHLQHYWLKRMNVSKTGNEQYPVAVLKPDAEQRRGNQECVC